jgi:hypothetical protein
MSSKPFEDDAAMSRADLNDVQRALAFARIQKLAATLIAEIEGLGDSRQLKIGAEAVKEAVGWVRKDVLGAPEMKRL